MFIDDYGMHVVLLDISNNFWNMKIFETPYENFSKNEIRKLHIKHPHLIYSKLILYIRHNGKTISSGPIYENACKTLNSYFK